MRLLIPLFLIGLLGFAAGADETPSVLHARVLAPFVDDQTFLAARMEVVMRIDVQSALEMLEKLTGDKTLAKVTKMVGPLRAEFLKAGGKDLYVLMNWATAIDEFLLIGPVGKDANPQELAALLEKLPGFKVEVRGKVVLAGPGKMLDRLRDFQARPVPELARAFASNEEAPAQVVLIPPAPLKRALLEMFPELPRDIGGGKTSALNFRWVAAGVDPAEPLSIQLTVQAADARAAEDIRKAAERALAFLAKNEETLALLPDFAKHARELIPKVDGDRLIFQDKKLGALLLPLFARQRQAAQRSQSVNNLRQIGLAMHAYHDAHKTFPPAASHDAQGKPLLSWRVHLLPWLEHNEVYKEFHLDEPWDSDHNKKLILRMPAAFRSPKSTTTAEGKTTYLAPIGPKTIFEGKKGMPLQKITDGTSNTILLVETDESRAVFWTQPEDYRIDAKQPLAGLVRPGARGFNALFADGSTRFLPADIAPDVLRALFTANGGEAVEVP